MKKADPCLLRAVRAGRRACRGRLGGRRRAVQFLLQRRVPLPARDSASRTGGSGGTRTASVIPAFSMARWTRSGTSARPYRQCAGGGPAGFRRFPVSQRPRWLYYFYGKSDTLLQELDLSVDGNKRFRPR